MKKNGARRASRNVHICRKCNQDDFKNTIEFTKHLKKCKGPAAAPEPARVPPTPERSVTLAALHNVSEQLGSLRTEVESLIKRLA